ncbi:alpha/beta fold hydrolase [Saccharopolyspora hattusasensis]|uniref:alpha/beta fold hydrolase n=1 Tax=Saccharopolyspora hattusasensis TaxID=1128679 RepID=UPI003D996DE8
MLWRPKSLTARWRPNDEQRANRLTVADRAEREGTGPALVVVGEEDTLTPPGNARELTGALSGSELVTLPGAGHLPSIESPDAFAEAVRPCFPGSAER